MVYRLTCGMAGFNGMAVSQRRKFRTLLQKGGGQARRHRGADGRHTDMTVLRNH